MNIYYDVADQHVILYATRDSHRNENIEIDR